MYQQLISRSPDLRRLRDDGYEIETKEGYLIVHHIPYVNSNRDIKFGKLISSLTVNNDITIRPDSHVMGFMGDHPCNKDGSLITAIQHSNPNQSLFDGIIMNYSFSNKPPGGYEDYYQKVKSYSEIITAQAKAIDPSVTERTFRVVIEDVEESVFNYMDTNSSRANINSINTKFKGQRIGIIGLGGTGSYILDLVAKTQVKEILLFDGDVFLQHNAFRSPGAPSIECLNEQFKKVDYFKSIYSKMHKGIRAHAEYISEENIELLNGLSYVFICIDNNQARGMIMSKLRQFGVTFIDVGFGVNIAEDNLVGSVRVTVGTLIKNDHIPKRIGTADLGDNEYSTNIQVADLNALNALMAVLKWKKMSGFYQDQIEEHHSTYTINTSQLLNDDCTA
jgi:predicted ThiF/HesA family dinucleotide-utilizing enzyme